MRERDTDIYLSIIGVKVDHRQTDKYFDKIWGYVDFLFHSNLLPPFMALLAGGL